MKTGFLEDIGMTKGEIKVYLSLLSLGQTTSGPIISESKISSSKVYEILEKLIQKGLASFIIKNKTKYFQATSPQKLRDYLMEKEKSIDEQKQELDKNLPLLIAKYKEHKIMQNAEIYLGLQGIKTMLWDSVENAKKGEEYLFIAGSGEEYRKAISRIYHTFGHYRHEKGLKVRGIGEFQDKALLKHIPHATIRYVDFPTPSNIAIYKNHVDIISWSESPIGILITSQHIADQFRKFFESMWKVAKR